MKRSPMKRSGQRAKRTRGSLFPKRRDKPFSKWIVEEAGPCVIAGYWITRRIGLNDERRGTEQHKHRCWGVLTPAHVGQHRATGAEDRGCLVPMCLAAHRFYDEHRNEFYAVTGASA
jgi:hypothetical protein